MKQNDLKALVRQHTRKAASSGVMHPTTLPFRSQSGARTFSVYPCLHTVSRDRAALPHHTLDTYHLKRFRPCVAVFLWIKLQGAKAVYLSGGGMHEFQVQA